MVSSLFIKPSSSIPVSVSDRPRSQTQTLRRPAGDIELTATERSHLEALVRDGGSPARERRRARLVLLATEGHDDGEISRRVGCSIATVRVWRRRFAKGRLRALPDAPHRCDAGGPEPVHRAAQWQPL
jgi:hypothetical protein